MPDKILIVDDEPDTVYLAKTILDSERYQVIVASNGKEAIQKTDTEMPDLILLDVIMPDISGLEVCKTLKTQPKTKLIPVVMFTALGREVDKKLIEDVKAEGYLVKPFESEDLIAVVKEHIDKVQPEKFSRAFDMDHAQLSGHKILLEFDPASPYERFVRNFVLEGRAHGEKAIVITPKSSVIFKTLQEEKGLEFALLEETIISPILDVHAKKPLVLVYDNLTELIIAMGFQPAYNFTRKTLDLLAEYKSTALFLLNPSAHQSNETNSIRNIFSERVAFGKDGLTKIKLT